MPDFRPGKGVEGDETASVGIEIELERKSSRKCTIDEPVGSAGRILSTEDEARPARERAAASGEAIGVEMVGEDIDATSSGIRERVAEFSP
jgi:hypothetical protein